MRKLLTIVFSDPSVAEALSIIAGIITAALGVSIVLADIAYMAGMYASPITPYSGVKGYVEGFNQEPTVLGVDQIRDKASSTFLDLFLKSKMIVWFIMLTTYYIVSYPILSRIRRSVIPAASVTGTPPTRLVMVGFILIESFALGFYAILLVLVAAMNFSYFGVSPSLNLLLAVSSVAGYIIVSSVFFYIFFMAWGRLELGILTGYLGALAFDTLALDVVGLFLADILLLIIGVLQLIVVLRWRLFSL